MVHNADVVGGGCLLSVLIDSQSLGGLVDEQEREVVEGAAGGVVAEFELFRAASDCRVDNVEQGV